jgi:hypothetical protein
MPQSGKKHMGPGSHGKGSGTGGLAPMPDVPENMVLSNRDKAQESTQRGQDSKWIQTEQLRNHEANHLDEDDDDKD